VGIEKDIETRATTATRVSNFCKSATWFQAPSNYWQFNHVVESLFL